MADTDTWGGGILFFFLLDTIFKPSSHFFSFPPLDSEVYDNMRPDDIHAGFL